MAKRTECIKETSITRPCPVCRERLTDQPACDPCVAAMDGTLAGLRARFGRDSQEGANRESAERARDREISEILDANARPKSLERTPTSLPPLKSLGEK